MQRSAILATVSTVAAGFRPPRAGKHSVYVALLAEPGALQPYGVYVGLTGLPVAQRFANHKKGHKASRCVRKHGVEVLPVGLHLRGIGWADAERIERELHRALVLAGVLAKGGH